MFIRLEMFGTQKMIQPKESWVFPLTPHLNKCNFFLHCHQAYLLMYCLQPVKVNTDWVKHVASSQKGEDVRSTVENPDMLLITYL